jgi:hypothetical protein
VVLLVDFYCTERDGDEGIVYEYYLYIFIFIYIYDEDTHFFHLQTRKKQEKQEKQVHCLFEKKVTANPSFLKMFCYINREKKKVVLHLF